MWDFLFHHTPLLYLTQSMWRDEAFSMLIAERSPLYFISNLIFEPPLYYFMLHVWVQLFGSSEIAARSLSLIGFLLANVVMVFWGENIFKKHWLSWFLPVFFFFNPQLLYYAFEIRAYGWYTFFAVLSMFAYWEKRWPLYITATVLGLYTHTYMIIVPAIQMLHYLLINRKVVLTTTGFFKDSFVRAVGLVGVLSAPWLIKIAIDLPKLKNSWYFPVDLQVIKSALGNVFLGYEGTPDGLWQRTAILSGIILLASLIAIKNSKTRIHNGFFFLLTFVPLIAILGISQFKPIFVNRYLLPVTIAEIFLIVLAIETIQHKLLQKLAAAIALICVFGFNMWYPSQHAKKDIRSTIYEINGLMTTNDVMLTDSPLILFEALYYAQDRSRVFWYNPNAEEFPWYIGDIAFSPSQMKHELPPYPTRAFIVHTDATFEVVYNTPPQIKKP